MEHKNKKKNKNENRKNQILMSKWSYWINEWMNECHLMY